MRISSSSSSSSRSSHHKYSPFALVFFAFTIVNVSFIFINEIHSPPDFLHESSFSLEQSQHTHTLKLRENSQPTTTLTATKALSNTNTKTKKTRTHPMKCLSFQNEFDTLVKSTKQVFITMPAKAAGSSLGSFVMDHCMKKFNHLDSSINGHYFNREEAVQQFITLNYQVPTIMSSHLGRKRYNALEQLVKAATDDSLILYVHRHETDRVLSGIKQVGERVCFNNNTANKLYEKYINKIIPQDENGNCIIDENVLFDMIKAGEQEISNGVSRGLSCEVFDAIEGSKPNIVVLNYQQADELQRVLAKYHCPEVLESGAIPVHINEAKNKKGGIFVRLSSDPKRKEPLDEWVEVKRHVIEWAFGMKKDVGCQRKIRDTEKKMFSCQDELVQFL